jgi:hypothetical protein
MTIKTKTIKKMTQNEILLAQSKDRLKIKQLEQDIIILKTKLEYRYRDICPHPKRYIYSINTTETCGLCNKVIKYKEWKI